MYRSTSTAVDISKLSYRQEGAALVVRLPLTINNSPHVVWTSVTSQPADIHLNFEVVQNRQLFVRSQKTIDLEWRLENWTGAEVTFHVNRAFMPSSEELEALLPMLQQLVDSGWLLHKG